MQLDFLIKSILRRFIDIEYNIIVLYHASQDHKIGYERLIENYYSFQKIAFVERRPRMFNIISYYKTFCCIKNVKRYFKYSYFKNKASDNFKELLESLLEKSNCEFVMFSTDDGFFYRDVKISSEIFSMIRSNPFQTSYRLYVGENLLGFPDYVKLGRNKDYYYWNYYENENKPLNHWTFPFAVDGTIYYTKSIKDFIQRVPYHNPVTLEAYVVEYIIELRKLRLGLSPRKSCLICTKLNRVSTCSNNPTINIDPDFLNSKYLDGYVLELQILDTVDNANVVPNKVFLTKDGHKHLIYEIDEYGKIVQGALGPEGTKFYV